MSRLSEFFEIGYHGHFYRKNSDGSYEYSFTPEVFTSQVQRESAMLKDCGLRPRAYAGGWWFRSKQLGECLGHEGFTLDTTRNDVGLDSFGHRQPQYQMEPLYDILSLKSLKTVKRSTTPALIALHDYDLPRSETLSSALGGMMKFVSFQDVVDKS